MKHTPKVVLYQSEIPHNVGSAIRLCAGMNAELHLIRPLGFTLNDKHLRRVALGYHQVLRPQLHNDMAAFLSSLATEEQLLLFSSKAAHPISQLRVSERVALLFGSETQGISGLSTELQIRLEARSQAVKIPQAQGFRCHNLANSIAIGLYEVQRQSGFIALE
ncbi:MAG: TrmH family RNA methyltransferase [Spirochaetota bacterium]